MPNEHDYEKEIIDIVRGASGTYSQHTLVNRVIRRHVLNRTLEQTIRKKVERLLEMKDKIYEDEKSRLIYPVGAKPR